MRPKLSHVGLYIEYAQALAFDQLRKVMENGEAFIGFSEASIDFPPTFKYDVLRYKRSKRAKSVKRVSRTPDSEMYGQVKLLAEEGPSVLLEEDRSEGEQDGDEAVSVASTAWTGQSKYTEVDDAENDDYFDIPSSPRLSNPVGNILNKQAASAAAHKAKAKWMSLIKTSHPSSAAPIFKRLKQKVQLHDKRESWRLDARLSPSLPSPPLTLSMPNSPPPEFKTQTLPPTPGKDSNDNKLPANEKFLMPPRVVEPSKASAPLSLVARSASSKSTDRLEQGEDDDEKGVYDTSHKQRVPSW